MLRRDLIGAAGAAAMLPALSRGAAAQGRAETLLCVAENGPPNLDAQGAALNRSTFMMSWNVYDRLVTFGSKDRGDGVRSFDFSDVKGELAQDFSVASDGMSMTFRLKPDATFHDGKPVTAQDVKWSFDRAVSVGGFPTVQMAATSITRPEQFVVLDDRTIRVDLPRREKLALANLAVFSAQVINAELAKRNATAADPWAKEWLGTNAAASGAFKVESYRPGQELVYVRNDAWKGGEMPKLRRVIFRVVPSPSNRRALMERGDADISFELPPKDVQEMAQARRLKVVGVPANNTVQFIGMNTQRPPFNNVLVRRAIACALPYEDMLRAVLYGRGRPLTAGTATSPASTEWPTPLPYRTDLDRAKLLLAEAGHPNGFETEFSFDLGEATVAEPMAVFIEQSLARIGIRVRINKLPAGQLAGRLARKELDFFTGVFGAWFDTPEYYFFLQYHQQNGPGNSAGFINPALSELVDAARIETDPARYDAQVKGFIQVAFDEVPYIPLWQPFVDVAMQQNVTGYTHWFHRQLDFRPLAKG